MKIAELLANYDRILTECAIAERLRRSPAVTLHPTLFHTPLIYGPDDMRAAMTSIYREYLTVASRAGLPLLLTAPTWRLDSQRVAEAGVRASINADAVEFMIRLREDFQTEAPILVGALVGPQNDCYRPELAPPAAAAASFHRGQIEELAATSADFLQTQTLPNVGEAIGIATEMARSGKPYFMSFCTGTDGLVLDGTPLPEAMAEVDSAVSVPPLGYYVNCTHPSFILKRYQRGELDRLVGIQANGSSKDVATLDEASETHADPIGHWSAEMHRLHEVHGVQILGGCCGTSLGHLEALAR